MSFENKLTRQAIRNLGQEKLLGLAHLDDSLGWKEFFVCFGLLFFRRGSNINMYFFCFFGLDRWFFPNSNL